MLIATVLSVSELTASIRSILEPNFRGISVRGEISNFKAQSSGHLYFSMKDAGSQISSVLFRGSAASLPRMPKDGDQVIAKGELSVYTPRGSYQLIIRELQFLGAGELLLRFQQLKETLAARGWFEKTSKKPLPSLPKRIGVITRPTGAVIQDILNVLTRRFAGFQVILNPVKVQGEGSAAEIAKAIDDMNRYDLADVLIVGRGGGSIEDLWAFNEEIVARSIFESRIPIISAVGHETDFTIADWVADVRAPTPSAAAEMVIAEKAQLLKHLERAALQSKNFLSNLVRQHKERLSSLRMHPLLAHPHSLLAMPSQKLDDLRQALEHLRPSHRIATMRSSLMASTLRLDETMRSILSLKQRAFSPDAIYMVLDSEQKRTLASKKDLLKRLESSLSSLHPKNLLKKGYAILFSEKENSIILLAKDLRSNQTFTAMLADGTIRATALQITETPDGPHI
jgi:exodeoxyribonuclease VII large subunit